MISDFLHRLFRREPELSDAEIIRWLDDRHRQDARQSHKIADDIAAKSQ